MKMQSYDLRTDHKRAYHSLVAHDVQRRVHRQDPSVSWFVHILGYDINVLMNGS
jgi:hypothetical protein